ncbi:hypothetical protein HDV01_007206 [Terramyces sp. JEL0728]|nr:hypothetical protein HDV01_007206 [Terramyces sp. JEL0728]
MPVETEKKKSSPRIVSPTTAAPATKKIKVETNSDFEMKMDNISVGNIRLDLDEVGDMDFDFFQPSKSATVETFPTPTFTQFSPPVTTPFSTSNSYSPSNIVNGVTPAPDPTSPFVFSQSPVQPEFISPTMSPSPFEPFSSPAKDQLSTIKPKSIHEVLLDPKESIFIPEGQLISTTSSTDPFSFKIFPDKWAPFKLNLNHIFGDAPCQWNYQPNLSLSKPKFQISKYVKKTKKPQPKSRDTTYRSEKFIQKYFPISTLESYQMQSFNIEPLIFEKNHPSYLTGLANCVEQLCEYYANFKVSEIIQHILNPTERLSEIYFNEISNAMGELLNGTGILFKIPLEDICKLEEDDSSQEILVGTIKLRRKKKTPEPLLENLPATNLILVHNNAQVSCNNQVIQFWDKFRICPVNGPKDVYWINIYPENENSVLDHSLQSYMAHFGSIWTFFGFGTQSLIKQVFSPTSESKYCIVLIYNPFNDVQTILDASILFSRLIHIIHTSTNISVDIIQSRVLLEFTTDEKTNFMQDSQVSNILNLLFSTYNRLPKIMDNDTIVYSAAYTMENIQDEPKFTLDVPNSSTLLLMEPDRIIYLTFGIFKDKCFAYWADSFGEYLYTDWIIFNSPLQLAEALLTLTESQFNLNGFMVRLVVSNIEVWTKLIKARFSEEGFASPESESLGSNIPEIKQPPSTPGSAYNTPQPGLDKKPVTKMRRDSSIISITLTAVAYSSLLVDKLEPKTQMESEWSQDGKNTCLYTWTNSQLPLFEKFRPIAQSWIFHESNEKLKSIHFGIHVHHQLHIRNSCFRTWNVGELPVVVKDIAKGYNLLRQTNLKDEWMFEYVTKRVKVMSMLN